MSWCAPHSGRLVVGFQWSVKYLGMGTLELQDRVCLAYIYIASGPLSVHLPATPLQWT